MPGRRRHISTRQRRERMKRARRRMVLFAAVLVCLALMSSLWERLAAMARTGMQAVQAFASVQAGEAELTLPAKEIYALQMGVFDSGESAERERQRLYALGIPCMVWQREQMRLVSAVALTREDLPADAAGGQDAYVITDRWPEVSLRLSVGEAELADVQAMLCMPDHLFDRLLQSEAEEPLGQIVQQAKEAAQKAVPAHPENALYTQLAQSLANWCTLMESAMAQFDAPTARRYASVSMGTLCRELRIALLGSADQQSPESTASAQRTPSTAADVMPPA